MMPEFSRTVRIDTLGDAARTMEIAADAPERAALAERFDLAAIDRLFARLSMSRKGDRIAANGTLQAAVTQNCVVTGNPVPAEIEEPFALEFRPQPATGAEEEIELGEAEMDVIFYDGAMIDVGEAVAETLSLALEPYPRSPEAEAALDAAGIKDETQAAREEAEAKEKRSPFAVLRKS
ncbi:YceD family protein [Sphingosinicella humi]|uniref:DUF177 domain-containing protein n=1 Tax=Allosphingosinicella humi TaxID=2068657 RepID=A0A2U2J257_9SPHN|nr:DUF177 domain-containing protein [Sphingosinicella humi]PWG02392.1 hypothetical protein DF286_05570 [Sphingosinicella humi]